LKRANAGSRFKKSLKQGNRFKKTLKQGKRFKKTLKQGNRFKKTLLIFQGRFERAHRVYEDPVGE